jgi:hypothetical protein
MTRTTMTALAAAIAMSFGPALAGDMTKATHKKAKAAIESEYKAAKTDCQALKDNARDICVAGAKGHERVSLAELEAAYSPSDKARAEVRLAKAHALHELAIEKCDDQAGNAKDVCIKEADAAWITAKAQMKANKEVAEARKTSASDSRDAAYAVAKEKCDAPSVASKDACLQAAKAQYGKS